MKKYLISIIFSALCLTIKSQDKSSSVIQAQGNIPMGNSKLDPYFSTFFKKCDGVPKNVVADFKPKVYSVVLEYKNGSLQPILFSDSASKEFIAFISENVNVIDAIPWKDIIPEVKGKKDFRIFWMHYYLLMHYDSGLYPWLSDEMIEQVKKAMSVPQSSSSPLFIAPPYWVAISSSGHREPPTPPNYKAIVDSLYRKQKEN